MKDRPTSVRPQQRPIDLHERREVRYWCAEFGLTYEQLSYVVEAVGASPAKVSEYLAVAPAQAPQQRSGPAGAQS